MNRRTLTTYPLLLVALSLLLGVQAWAQTTPPSPAPGPALAEDRPASGEPLSADPARAEAVNPDPAPDPVQAPGGIILQPAANPAPSAQAEPPAPATAKPTKAEKPETPLPIDLKGSVTPASGYIGDPISVTYQFTASAPFTVKLSGNPNFGSFDLTDKSRQEGPAEAGYAVSLRYQLIGFETGNQEIPAQAFQLDMDGHTQRRESRPLRVEVKSLLDEEGQKLALREMQKRKAEEANSPKPSAPANSGTMGPTLTLPQGQTPQGAPPAGTQTMMIGPDGKPIAVNPNDPQSTGQQPMQIKLDPRGDKPPVPLMQEDYTLAYVAGVLLSILFVVGGSFLWRRFRPEPEAKEEVDYTPPPRPAHEIALERLHELDEQNLPAKRKWERFHTQLSFIVREYLQNRYNLDALEMTSDEIVKAVRGMYLRGVDERLFVDFFTACDLVKFARHEPEESHAKTLFDQATLLVERTREDGV